MSLLVVEQTQTLFLGGKTLWRQREKAAKPTSPLAGSFTLLSSHTISSTSFCVLPPTLPTQTHTCTSLFSPIYPFPLGTMAGCLWVQAQTQHMGGKLTGGISPFPPSCHAALLQNPSPLLPLLHTYIPISAHIPPQNCTRPTGRAGRWLTAALLLQTTRCNSSCGQTWDKRVMPQLGPKQEECIPLPHPCCTGPAESS